jgi:ferric-dicitrate binding protein FerR (iron transport regulator)
MLVSQLVTEAPMVASVVSVFGTAETGARGHAMTTLRANEELHAGSVLETDGDGGVALQLATGHSLRLAAATRVRIEADSVVLDAGSIYLDSGEGNRATPIEVRSRLATVRELGTQYMAQLTDSSLQVSVREGAVRVSDGNMFVSAIAGEMLHLDEFGNTEKLAVSTYGKRWTWVSKLARVPALEELTLAEFLHWLVREYGWQLEFKSPELARYAGTVELFGSIDGLSGEEALATVMLATRWHYRLTEGLLIVESRGEDG